MAVIRPIEARQTIDVGGVPNTRVDGSVGEGLQAVGGAVQQAANVLASIDQRRAQMKAQADDFRADQGFRRFGDDMSLEFAKTQQEIDPSGEGFTDQVSTRFNEKAEQFLQTVPEEFRGKFSELVRTSRESWINKAAAAEIDQRNTWYRDGIAKSQEGLQNQVFNDPQVFDAALSDGNRAIESSGLPPVEKEKLKEAWKNTLAQTVGEREVRDAEADPKSASDAANKLGVGPSVPLPKDVQDRANLARDKFVQLGYSPEQAAGIVGNLVQESSVRSDGPDGDNGTASGLAQWRGERLTKLKRFAGARGKNWRDFDTQIAFIDVELQQDEPAAYAALKRAKTVDEATAAFIGFERPRGWTAANPRGGHGWANRLAAAQRTAGVEVTAAGPVETDPRYASLPLADRLKIYDQVQAAAQRGQTAIDAQIKVAYDAEKGAIQLGIQTGEVASPVQIMQSGMSDGDKATLLSALRTRQGDMANVADSVRLFGQGALSVDPYDSKGKNTVDAVWKEVSQAAPVEQLQQTAEALVAQTGVVPQAIVNEIRHGLTSGNAQQVARAAQAAQRLSTVDAEAFSRRDGGSEVQKSADDFSYYVNKLNMSPDDAAKKLVEMRSPEKQRDRKALEPAAKEFLKSMQDTDLASAFDDSLMGWRSNPSLGVKPGQELGIKADFLAIAENEFYLANGDPEIAQNRAMEQMKRLYGVSGVTGSNVVMKHPPERYWPPEKGFGKDSYGYVKDQIYQEYKDLFPDDVIATQYRNFLGEGSFIAGGSAKDIDSIRRQWMDANMAIVSTSQTDAMVKRGEMPAYSILFKDFNGVYQTLPGKLFQLDAKPMQERRIDDARDAQTLNRNVIEGVPAELQDSGMQGNPLMSSDPAALESQQTAPKPEPLPKAQTPAGAINQQRQQLFDDARDNGILPGNP